MTVGNYYALFPLQNKQSRPWEVCSPDDHWSFAASHSLMHFINRCTVLEVIAVLHYNKHEDIIHAYVSKACVSSKQLYLRHQAYTLYYHHVCILVFLHVFAYSMLLRCMLKFKRLACGSEDVTQYNTIFVWLQNSA